ncbi:SPRY domain protein [Cooperia oncophora]
MRMINHKNSEHEEGGLLKHPHGSPTCSPAVPGLMVVLQGVGNLTILLQTNLEAAIWGNEVLFHPVYAFGTAGIRGAKQLTATSIVYWDTRVCQNLFGTSIMFGVGTKHASTRARSQFVDLLGEDEHSYGISRKGLVRHCGIEVAVCDPLPYRDCVVGILFDGPGRKISFYRNGEYLCTPFTDIDVSEPLYPMLSSTAQQSRFVIENQACLYVAHSLTESALMRVSTSLPQQLHKNFKRVHR